jgi:hypothetical protein
VRRLLDARKDPIKQDLFTLGGKNSDDWGNLRLGTTKDGLGLVWEKLFTQEVENQLLKSLLLRAAITTGINGDAQLGLGLKKKF